MVLGLLACSRDAPLGRRCPAGSECLGEGGTSAGAPASGGSGVSGMGGAGGDGELSSNALRVSVQTPDAMTIEVLTLRCAGDCADIEAVARGGNPPYAYAWEDGSTSATRHVCLDDSAELSVSARDTAVVADEFSYDAHSTSTSVTAEVLECSDAGAPPEPGGPFCIENPSLEGTPGLGEQGLMLPSWTICAITPDVSPGVSTIAASDGETYVAMVNFANDVLTESAGGLFCAPLEPGKAASFTVDIGVAAAFGGGPSKLELWGGSASCTKEELLWTSPVIDDIDMWHSFCGTIVPTMPHDHFVLWPVMESDAGSYLIVDNFEPAATCD